MVQRELKVFYGHSLSLRRIPPLSWTNPDPHLTQSIVAQCGNPHTKQVAQLSPRDTRAMICIS